MPRKKKEKEEIVEPKPRPGNIEDFADCAVTDELLLAKLAALGFQSNNPKGMTYKEAMLCSLIANAAQGNLKAYEAIANTVDKKKDPPLVSFLRGEQDTVLGGPK